MKLPKNAIIAPEKIHRYLLITLPDSDKALFLSTAGYSLENWSILLKDIRSQLLPLNATLSRETKFGTMYEIRGTLKGPNGKRLKIISVWMNEFETKQTKFITLYPDKEK